MTPNPFSSLQPPDSGSEQIVQAKAGLDEAVEKAYNKYMGLKFHNTPGLAQRKVISRLKKQILLPNQIDHLLQLIIQKTEPEKLNSKTTGFYLSRLIQDSYDSGNNGFILTTGDTYIENIGSKICGEENRRIGLQIDGNVGELCASWARYIKIVISGNASFTCGASAKQSEISIYGNVDDFGGWRARDTIFTAYNKRAYDVFKKYAYHDKINTIRLADSSGKIIKEEKQLWF